MISSIKFVNLKQVMGTYQKAWKSCSKLDSKIFTRRCQLKNLTKYFHITIATINLDHNWGMLVFEILDASVT
jgi:hypothetical protein